MTPNAERPGVFDAGLILAAGRSRRMAGRTKALLEIRDPAHGIETFVGRSIRILGEAGIAECVVVANAETQGEIAAAAGEAAFCAINPDPDRGMVSSVLCGLEALKTTGKGMLRRLLVTLVDIPEIDVGVVRALLAHHPEPDTWMALPVFEDGRGHPLVLYPPVFGELTGDLPRGFKTLMERDPARIAEVRVEGRQPWDVDTPADYGRYSGT